MRNEKVRLALDVIRDEQLVNETNAPRKTRYYLVFAGRHCKDISLDDIASIDGCEWQRAKELVFDFEGGVS